MAGITLFGFCYHPVEKLGQGQWKTLNNFDKIESTPIKITKDVTSTATPYEEVLQNLKSEFPNAVEFSITLSKSQDEPIYSYVTVANHHKEDRYFGPVDGSLIKANKWEDFGLGRKFNYTKYEIHVGSILGLPNKILWFLVSFVCAALPITGFLIWWGRRKKKHLRKNAKKSVTQNRELNGSKRKTKKPFPQTPVGEKFGEINE